MDLELPRCQSIETVLRDQPIPPHGHRRLRRRRPGRDAQRQAARGGGATSVWPVDQLASPAPHHGRTRPRCWSVTPRLTPQATIETQMATKSKCSRPFHSIWRPLGPSERSRRPPRATNTEKNKFFSLSSLARRARLPTQTEHQKQRVGQRTSRIGHSRGAHAAVQPDPGWRRLARWARAQTEPGRRTRYSARTSSCLPRGVRKTAGKLLPRE